MLAAQTLQDILEQGLVSRVAAQQSAPAPAACPSGIAPLDQALPGGGLGLGMTHEWILEAGFAPGDWRPPLLLMTWLASRAAADSGLVILIGRRCWTSAWMLRRVGLDLATCILVEPHDEDQRLWAIDQCLRCPGVSAVLADASGLDMGSSRRLQLAAEAGGGLGLLARMPEEVKSLSAAATRWVVSPRVSETKRVSWKVELRRCKAGASWGLWSGTRSGSVREWALEWNEGPVGGGRVEAACETGGVRVAADVAGGPGRTAGRKTA